MLIEKLSSKSMHLLKQSFLKEGLWKDTSICTALWKVTCHMTLV